MRAIHKSYFTLLELLVVLLLISLGMGLTGMKVREVYSEQHFLSEVEQVVSHLRLAQDIMLVMQTDASIQFKKDADGKKLCYRIKAEKPVNTQMKQILNKEYSLKSIHKIEFTGKSARLEGGLLLDFFSKGMYMSQGKLILFENESGSDGKAYQIELTGNPHFIVSQKYKPDGLAKAYKPVNTNLYPKILLEEPDEKDPEDKSD